MSMFWAPYVAPWPGAVAAGSSSGGDGPEVIGAVVCALFVVLGIRMLVKDRRLRSTGIHVPGVVIRLEPSMKTRGGTIYHPVFAFTTVEGIQLQVRSPVGTDKPGVAPGQQVTIVYEAAKPEEACIDTPAGRGVLIAWPLIGFSAIYGILLLFPGRIGAIPERIDAIPGNVMLFLMGALLIVAGIMVIWHAERRRRRAQGVGEVAGTVVTLVQAPSNLAGGIVVLIGSIMVLTAIVIAF